MWKKATENYPEAGQGQDAAAGVACLRVRAGCMTVTIGFLYVRGG
jgi:hypothetical protein